MSDNHQSTQSNDQSIDRHADSQRDQHDQDAIRAAFIEVSGQLMRYATDAWINLDLSIAQIKTIFILHYVGAQSVNGLAERMNIGAPTASHLVEKLVQAGLASRTESPTDRRVVFVSLTEDGHALTSRLWVPSNRIIGDWISQLTLEQRQALATSLQALIRIIRKDKDKMLKGADYAP